MKCGFVDISFCVYLCIHSGSAVLLSVLMQGFINCVIYMSSCRHSSFSCLAAATETESDPARLLIFENVTSSLVGYIQACQTQINIGQGSAFVNVGNTPMFVTYFSFNLVMLMLCIDFDLFVFEPSLKALYALFPLILFCYKTDQVSR